MDALPTGTLLFYGNCAYATGMGSVVEVGTACQHGYTLVWSLKVGYLNLPGVSPD